MQTCPRHSLQSGLSWIEVLIVIGVLAVLASLLLPSTTGGGKGLAARIRCVDNQKQAGLAHHLWASDHDNEHRFAFASTNAEGSRPYADSPEVFRHYAVLSNELTSPRVLICPADKKRKVANYFNELSNGNLSYFVGLDSNPTDPSALLSGDRNVTGGEVRNRFLRRVSAKAPIVWTNDLHEMSGNVGLADGSVQQLKTPGLLQHILSITNTPFRLAIP